MLPLAEAVRGYAALPLEFQPDSKWSYSNEGINTAGRIIEVVSGMPYQDFMQKRLFDPLGMKDTTFWPTEEQVKRLAKSYKPGKDNKGLEELQITYLHYPLTDPKRQPMPAGGLFSTAADVAAFCQMLLNGGTHAGKRVLSEDAVRQMTSTQTGDLLNKGKGENGYGLGLSTTRKAKAGRRHPRPGRTRRRLRHQHADRPGARPHHRLHGAARRLSGKRGRQGPRRLREGGGEGVR